MFSSSFTFGTFGPENLGSPLKRGKREKFLIHIYRLKSLPQNFNIKILKSIIKIKQFNNKNFMFYYFLQNVLKFKKKVKMA